MTTDANTKEVLTRERADGILILANIGELTAAVHQRVAGNDISTSLNGATLTRETVAQMAINEATAQINKTL